MNRKAMFGAAVLIGFALVALVGPLLVGDPSEPVDVPLLAPSAHHWLGTTGQGQDVLAQTIAGARSSLAIGIITGFLVVALGALVGTTAAFFGGWVDELFGLGINLFLLMPGLPLMVVIAAYLPPSAARTVFVLVFAGWAWSARVIRAQALSIRQRDFIAAAIVGGERPLRIIAVEMLPNMTSLLASALIGSVIYAIGAQVGLEFLGLGDPNRVTWGTNLYWAANDSALLTGSWWTFVPTGTCVALVGFALAMVNQGIDELGNPRLRGQRAAG
jgi:peptide/nickel transport system permease protein